MLPPQVLPAFKWNVLTAPAALSCFLEQARAPPQCAGARTHRMRREASPRSIMSVLVRLCAAPYTTARPPLLFPAAPPCAFAFASLFATFLEFPLLRSTPAHSFFLSICFLQKRPCIECLSRSCIECLSMATACCAISFLCTVLVVGGNPFVKSWQLLARQASAQDAHTTLLVARLRLCGGKRPSRAMGGNAAGAPGRAIAQELLYEHTLKEVARAKVAFCCVPPCLQNEPRFVR